MRLPTVPKRNANNEVPMARRLAVLFTALFVFASGTAFGQSDRGTPSVPDLVGVWRLVAMDGIFGDQVITDLAATEITIDRQQGAVFTGSLAYEVNEDEPAFHDGTSLTRMASEPFLGVMGWDNRSFTIAEREDSSLMMGELLNTETMALVFVEAGAHAFAARMLFVRQ